MLVIKTHYCLTFHRVAIIACLIAVTFGINLLVDLVSQNSFAQDNMFIYCEAFLQCTNMFDFC
jgi:hypothetical protein